MKWITRMTCGCAVKTDRFQNTTIDYCPKHKSAPDLYEACKGLLEIAEIAMPDTYLASDSRVNKARKALAKAES